MGWSETWKTTCGELVLWVHWIPSQAPIRSNPFTPPPWSLTLSRLAPRRGKKQAKRNLPQLMTAARHQLRRAMPASVPSRLPASYLWDRILQPPVKRTVSSGKKKKDPAETGDPLVLVRGAEMNWKPSFKSDDDWGFIFLSGFFFFFIGKFGYLSGYVSAIPICGGGTRGATVKQLASHKRTRPLDGLEGPRAWRA